MYALFMYKGVKFTFLHAKSGDVAYFELISDAR